MSLSGAIIRGLRLLRRFIGAREASVTVEFIVSIPILLAVLVFTSEYGRVLQMRSTLDNAVADAARYLSRVPLNNAGDGFTPEVVAIAEGLVTSRINTRYVAVGAPRVDETNGFPTVRMDAAAGVTSPALALLALGGPSIRTENGLKLKDVKGLVVVSSETVRHFGR